MAVERLSGGLSEGSLREGFHMKWLQARPSRVAARAVAHRALAIIAGLAFTVSAVVPQAAAQDEAATIKTRGDVASSSAATSAEMVETSGMSLYEVGQRDVDYPVPPTSGELIVGLALQYVGYPYWAAGNGPYGFDCSGFTQFIILNTLGWDIGHGLQGQPSMGAWVDYGAWLPGDLIFFQNTYQAGLSHVGIYIGDGLIVHAENEGTGVTISNIYSSYYGPRYWGAVRVG